MGDDTNRQQPSDASEESDHENAPRWLSSALADEAFMSAVILRPREPFLNWVREQLRNDVPSIASEAAIPGVAITPEQPRAEDQEAWLRQYSDELFTRQLEVWASEENWPADRSLEALRAWFDVEFVPTVDDLRAYRVHPEVTCAPVSLAEMVSQFDHFRRRRGVR